MPVLQKSNHSIFNSLFQKITTGGIKLYLFNCPELFTLQHPWIHYKFSRNRNNSKQGWRQENSDRGLMLLTRGLTILVTEALKPVKITPPRLFQPPLILFCWNFQPPLLLRPPDYIQDWIVNRGVDSRISADLHLFERIFRCLQPYHSCRRRAKSCQDKSFSTDCKR